MDGDELKLESASTPQPAPMAPRAPVASSSRPSQRHIDGLLHTLSQPAPVRDEPYVPPTYGRASSSYGRATDPAAELEALCSDVNFRREVSQLKASQDELELSLVDRRNRIIADADRQLKALADGTSATDAIRRKTIAAQRVKALQAFDQTALERFDLLRRRQTNTLLQLGVPEPIEEKTIARLVGILNEGDA